MTGKMALGVVCLLVGAIGTVVVLFTDVTYWLLSVGGPYFGMLVGSIMVALAFVGFALVLPMRE